MVAARSAANKQILFVLMNSMTDLFFQSIIGEQAEKSAQVGRQLANKSGDKLWLSVADGMFAEIKERCGKHGEAEAARIEGMKAFNEMPEELKRRLTLDQNDGGV